MKKIKKPVSMLLSLILIFSVFTIISATPAGALVDVSYLDLECNVQLVQRVRQLNSTALSGGMYAVNTDYDVYDRYVVTGNVSLVLYNNVTLHAHKGITVEGDGRLTIWQEMPEEGKETGKLIIDSPDDGYAGIGCGPQDSGGNIIINGGTVTVTGGANAAAIGGTDSTVTINRGTVTATGGANAAGIGGTNSNVTINGGTVTANSGSQGAGIGGTVTLNNGNIPYGEVSVTSDSYSGAVTLAVPFYEESIASYPAGAVSDNSVLAGKTIKAYPWNISYIDENGEEQTLTQSYTEITSDMTALSTGWYAVAADTVIRDRIICTGDVRLILCNNTTLDALIGITVSGNNILRIYGQPEEENSVTGKLNAGFFSIFCYWSGIGGDDDNNSCGTVIINGGIVNAKGYQFHAGIGGGHYGNGGNITINGGTVTATGGQYGAGIGGGTDGSGGKITINGGTVTATGGQYGAGIGGGDRSIVYSIVINGGTVTAKGGSYGSGIGGGDDVDPREVNLLDKGEILIGGGTVTAIGGTDAADIGGGGGGVDIKLHGGTVSAIGEFGIGNGKNFQEYNHPETCEVTFEWTQESKHTMSVYSKTYDTAETEVKFKNSFKDENGTVYAAGTVDKSAIACKTLTPGICTITWENHDGTVLETDEVDAGTLPTYKGSTPVRQPDEIYTYTFVGWTPEIIEATADATYTATFKPADGYFSGHSLTLDGDIGINFYADLTEAQFTRGAVVDFAWTVNGEEKTHSVTLTANDLTGNGYKATCPVAVAEMTCDVNATLTIGGVQVDTDAYSVKRYADTILSDDYKTKYLAANHTEEEYNKLATLVKAMLIYGAKAQIWFDRNLDDLADEGLDYTLAEVTPEMISPSARDMESGLDAYGLKYEGSTIVYLSKTSLRHYYTITDQAKFDLVKDSVMLDAEPVDHHTKNGQIYFEVTDIAAADLDTPYPLQIGTDIYSYTVLDYVRECIKSKYTPFQTMKLVFATYWYNQAANAYFGR